ncbi:MAG TPA: hypothetical protein VE032_04050 [Actinomycetota bacterium]|nr:hypothetical protein [Actinomycetota bacterium]
MASSDTVEQARRAAVIAELEAVGIDGGVFHTMAAAGQLIDIVCETPKCYCPQGREFFPKPPIPDSDWDPTIDHYPILRSNGGHKDPWNVRLAHKLCNREDYSWRARITEMIKEGLSLEQMAEELNRTGVQRPQGSGPWSAESVRRAFVS